jgi:HD-GYP domain-containing protein (c-di-GMP phosphodiesterase class II)
MSLPEPSAHSATAVDLATEQRVDVLEHLLAIGTALSSVMDLDSLLRLILDKSREITKSDAGSVLLLDRSNPASPQLVFKIAQNDSLPGLQVQASRLPLNEDSLAGHVALSGKPLNIMDANSPPAGITFNSDFDRQHGYRTVSLLVLPMLNQQGEVIGVLQLINRKKSSRARLTLDNAEELTQPYSPLESRILMSLASQAAISIERQQLQKSVEDLFEGFVRASVEIIEARDPTTAGHSERVAAMTVRLADEVSQLDHGPFRETRFEPRQIQEIRYAALLHDFGKVGVPEAVLLKAKKLYPSQLEGLRYRFALARHELDLQFTRERLMHLVGHPECASSCGHPVTDETTLKRAHARLDTYWDLLMRLNEPLVQTGEITDELRVQLAEIAAYSLTGAQGAQEPLVSERELEQLLISKGSLTEAERQMIESHVSQTFHFLRQIPWTTSLRLVPDIAHGHHEKLDGSGYPLGLNAAQIPLQSQMMTVSDIYDALAASDRPYKKALPVHRAIAILREEADRSHVNGELVEVFEQRRVFDAATR